MAFDELSADSRSVDGSLNASTSDGVIIDSFVSFANDPHLAVVFNVNDEA